MALTGKQRRALRALGHSLAPVVQLGKGGLSASLVGAVDEALATHELIKIKLLDSAELDRHEAATQLAGQTHSEIAQVLGNTLVRARPAPMEPRLALP